MEDKISLTGSGRTALAPCAAPLPPDAPSPNPARVESELRRQAEELALLHEAGHLMGRTLDPDIIYDTVRQMISRTMDCHGLIVSLYTPEDNLIRCTYAWIEGSRLEIETFPALPLAPEGQGLQSTVIRTGCPHLVADLRAQLQTCTATHFVDADGNFDSADPAAQDEDESRSVMIVPIKLEGRVLGAVQVLSPCPHVYTDSHLRLVEALMTQVAAANRNAYLYRQAMAEIEERRQAQEELARAHAEIELRVEQRTAELAETNQALQAEMIERKEVERQLRRVSAQSQHLLASVPSILIGVEETGVISAWNQAAQDTFGRHPSEVLQMPLRECGIAWDWAAIEAAVARCVASGQPLALDDTRYVRPDGTEGILTVNLNPLRDPVRGATGVLLLASDITERRILESQLAQAQKMEALGQMAAGIAHEINTPIQFIGSNIRFFQQGFADLGQVWECISDLTQETTAERCRPEAIERLRTAIDNADLEYLRAEVPEATRQSLDGIERVAGIVQAMKYFTQPGNAMTPTDLNHSLESTLEVAAYEWKYVADLVLDLQPDLPLVPCVPSDLNQVFLNIIVNATHAIKDVVGEQPDAKGQITVTTRAANGWAEISIRDTGAGIPDAIRQKIFDPFFTTKEVGRGTGQGLAIAHSVVVDKHDGSITVESEVGHGATFILRIPLQQSSAATEAGPA